VSLHVEHQLVLRRPGLRSRKLLIQRSVWWISKEPPTMPARPWAWLNASKVLATPQDETRKLRREMPSFFEFNEANSCARRLAATLAGASGTGTYSPLEVLSSLIGRRVPSGSMIIGRQ
jgi:hypothetical protein